MNPILVITILVVIAILLVFVGLHRWMSWSNEIQQRLAGANPQAGVDMFNRTLINERFNKRLKRTSFAGRIEQQLSAADSSLTPAEYIMLRIACALFALLLGWLISGQLIGGGLLLIVGWAIPAFIIRRQQANRMRAFGEQLPDMLNLLVGSLRAGYGLMQACNAVCQEMPEPISKEFARVVKEASLGYSLEQALAHMLDRLQNDDLELIITAINVQNEVGGSLAEVLATIAETIRERVKVKGEIRVLTAQQRMTGWILSMLPFGLGTIMMLLNPDYMMGLFQPGWILIIPIGAGVMMILGNITMQWLMQIEV